MNKNVTEKVKNQKTESKKKNPSKEEQKSLFSDVFNDDEEIKPTPKEDKQTEKKRKDFDQLFQSDKATEPNVVSNKMLSSNINNVTSQRNNNTSSKKTKTKDDLDDLII